MILLDWCPYSEKLTTEETVEICHKAMSEGAIGQVVVVYSDDAPHTVL